MFLSNAEINFFQEIKNLPTVSGDFLSKLCLCLWNDTHELRRLQAAIEPAALVLVEHHLAREDRVERVVFAAADIFPRVNASPALADKDRACVDDFAIADFRSEILRLGITPETG